MERLGIAGAEWVLQHPALRQQHEGLCVVEGAAVLGEVRQGGPFPSGCPGVGAAVGGQRASPAATELLGERRGVCQSTPSIPTPCAAPWG